jgi:imidazolonepropionase-like amidohydrolase
VCHTAVCVMPTLVKAHTHAVGVGDIGAACRWRLHAGTFVNALWFCMAAGGSP